MSPRTPHASPLRDRIAVPILNFMFRLASKQYRDFVRGAIRYGMRAAARDDFARKPLPSKDWKDWAVFVSGSLPTLNDLGKDKMAELDPGDPGYRPPETA